MTEVDPRQIQWLPLTELVEDPSNPKAHSEDLIDASMGKHGVIDLITRDDRTAAQGNRRTSAYRLEVTADAHPDYILNKMLLACPVRLTIQDSHVEGNTASITWRSRNAQEAQDRANTILGYLAYSLPGAQSRLTTGLGIHERVVA